MQINSFYEKLYYVFKKSKNNKIASYKGYNYTITNVTLKENKFYLLKKL